MSSTSGLWYAACVHLVLGAKCITMTSVFLQPYLQKGVNTVTVQWLHRNSPQWESESLRGLLVSETGFDSCLSYFLVRKRVMLNLVGDKAENSSLDDVVTKEEVKAHTVAAAIVGCSKDRAKVEELLTESVNLCRNATCKWVEVDTFDTDRLSETIQSADLAIIMLSDKFVTANLAFQTLIFILRSIRKPCRYYNLMPSYIDLVSNQDYAQSSISLLVGNSMVYTNWQGLMTDWVDKFKLIASHVASDVGPLAPMPNTRYLSCYCIEDARAVEEIVVGMKGYSFETLTGVSQVPCPVASTEEVEEASPRRMQLQAHRHCALVFVSSRFAADKTARAILDAILTHRLPMVVVVVSDHSGKSWIQTGLGIILSNELWVDFSVAPFYKPGEVVPSFQKRIRELSIRLRNACVGAVSGPRACVPVAAQVVAEGEEECEGTKGEADDSGDDTMVCTTATPTACTIMDRSASSGKPDSSTEQRNRREERKALSIPAEQHQATGSTGQEPQSRVVSPSPVAVAVTDEALALLRRGMTPVVTADLRGFHSGAQSFIGGIANPGTCTSTADVGRTAGPIDGADNALVAPSAFPATTTGAPLIDANSSSSAATAHTAGDPAVRIFVSHTWADSGLKAHDFGPGGFAHFRAHVWTDREHAPIRYATMLHDRPHGIFRIDADVNIRLDTRDLFQVTVERLLLADTALLFWSPRYVRSFFCYNETFQCLVWQHKRVVIVFLEDFDNTITALKGMPQSEKILGRVLPLRACVEGNGAPITVGRVTGVSVVNKSYDRVCRELCAALTEAPDLLPFPAVRLRSISSSVSPRAQRGASFDVLLSYCWYNSTSAYHAGHVGSVEGRTDPRLVHAQLEAATGLRCWLDVQHLLGSAGLFQGIHAALSCRTLKCVILCVSDEYVKSPNCMMELEYAIRRIPCIVMSVGNGYAWRVKLAGYFVAYQETFDFVTSPFPHSEAGVALFLRMAERVSAICSAGAQVTTTALR